MYSVSIGAVYIELRRTRPRKEGKRPVQYVIFVNAIAWGDPITGLDNAKRELINVVEHFRKSQGVPQQPETIDRADRALIANAVEHHAARWLADHNLTLAQACAKPIAEKTALTNEMLPAVVQAVTHSITAWQVAKAQPDHLPAKFYIELGPPNKWLKPIGWQRFVSRLQSYVATTTRNLLREGGVNHAWNA